MRYIPQKENNAPTVLSGLCIFAAAVCLLMSGVPYMPRGLLQICMAGFAVAAIQLTQRFILTTFEYELAPLYTNGAAYYGDGVLTGVDEQNDDAAADRSRYDFAVTRVQGTRRRTVCSLSTANLRAVYADNKKNRIESVQKYGKTAQIFNFRRNLFPQRPITCLFEIDDRLVEIRLECDEAFGEELSRRV